MIDWNRIRKERRIKLIAVPRCMIEDYLIIAELPDLQAMSVYDLPTHWTVGGVAYDFPSGSFMFEILSPEFEKNKIGTQIEIITEIRHTVDVTRTEMSA